jgi:hypothetical protein
MPSRERRPSIAAPSDISEICRKRIEDAFGWVKAQAGDGKDEVRGRAKVEALWAAIAKVKTLSASAQCGALLRVRPAPR